MCNDYYTIVSVAKCNLKCYELINIQINYVSIFI